MNSSLFICEQLILINSLISESIRSLGHELLGGDICFSELINQANVIIFLENSSGSIFSIDGILKMIFSFSFFNIIFSYSVRYIMIKVFILISPFAFLSLSTPNTSVFFKCWIKSFLALLFIELLASIILIVMFSITYSSKDITSKLLLIGSLFALIKSNSYIKELIGGINTEISDSMYMLRTFMK